MRWIILLLLLINTGYFAWGTFQQSQSVYAVQEPQTFERQAGKRLVLWSEVNNSTIRADEPTNTATRAEKANDIPPAPAPRINDNCLTIGPFETPDLADQVQQRLFSLGVSSREHADSNNGDSDYWVHIPPLSDRNAAIRLLRELQGQKIDSFVITQGELKNGISLGLFSQEASANKVSRRLFDAGYETQIKALLKQPPAYWLHVMSGDAGNLTEEIQSVLAEEYNGLKILEKNCKSIAS